MTDRDPVETTNLDQYGNPALPWSRAHNALTEERDAHRTFFLGTVGAEGRPHAAGVGAVFVDGDLYIVAGPHTRKARNLEANPTCTVSVVMRGIDLVLEGVGGRVVDPDTLERLARVYREGGWPAEVEGDAFTAPYTAPSGGPPPWNLYRVTVRTVFGLATEEPFGATRWRFAT
jgi:predicted pyridoxine 5'-phosphate oxidase superfamily flavin-nucleotide-binding protein